MRLIQGPSDTWGHTFPRTCDARCYNAKGPKCHCVCDGMNHGVGERQAVLNTKERHPKYQVGGALPVVLKPEARSVFLKTLTAVVLLVLLGCAGWNPDAEVAHKENCVAKWTDTDEVTHCGHMVRLIGNLTPDSLSTAVVGRRYWCVDDSTFFNVPMPPFEMAR